MALDKDKVRQDVIAIARDLVASGGAAGLQARTIAKRADISVGSIYNLVGDMDALHRLVNSELLDMLGVAGTAAMRDLEDRGVTDLKERLLALSFAYLEFVSEHKNAWDALLSFNRASRLEDTPDWYMTRLDALFNVIADELRETDIGKDDETRTTAARALWSAVHGIVTNAYFGRDDRLPVEAIRMQITLLIGTFVRGLEKGG